MINSDSNTNFSDNSEHPGPPDKNLLVSSSSNNKFSDNSNNHFDLVSQKSPLSYDSFDGEHEGQIPQDSKANSISNDPFGEEHTDQMDLISQENLFSCNQFNEDYEDLLDQNSQENLFSYNSIDYESFDNQNQNSQISFSFDINHIGGYSEPVNPFANFSFEDDQYNYTPTDNYESTMNINSSQEQSNSILSTTSDLKQNPSSNVSSDHEVPTSSTNFNERSTSRRSTRSPKRKVDLSEKSKLFMSAFYKIFTTKTKFKKALVKQIHNYICQYLPLSKMSRAEERFIALYFKEYSKYSEIILSSIQQHKEELLDAIPELAHLP